MAPPRDDRHEAMDKLAKHLEQLSDRADLDSKPIVLDGVVQAFADRVQRLEREL